MAAAQRVAVQADQSLPDKILSTLIQAESLADRAKSGKQSLSGSNNYAEKFQAARIQAIRALKDIQTLVSPFASTSLGRTIDDVEKELTYFFTPKRSKTDRRDLRRHLEELLKTQLEPALESAKKLESEFVPIEILENTRGYLLTVAEQVNNCFHHKAYDACGVMVRKLLEILIIEVFENKGIDAKIKDGDGNYLMFTNLVTKLINSPEINVGRTVKNELPKIAIVLNNCAHNRLFAITRPQLVNFQAIIVIATQELVTLSELVQKNS